MGLFFDAAWFDARLREKGLDRAALGRAAGLERSVLHQVFIHERAPSADELKAFADLLGLSVVEISLRCGVADAQAPPAQDAAARIDNMEARLDAIEAWLAGLEADKQRA